MFVRKCAGRLRRESDFSNGIRFSIYEAIAQPHAKLDLAMTALFILGLGLIASSSVDWFSLKRSLRNRFSNLDWITTRELSDWLGRNLLRSRLSLR